MLNFRKLKQDFSSNIITEGKELYDDQKVISAKILRLDREVIRFSAKVLGKFNNTYESELEIDRLASQLIHSNCDCTYRYDCQHLAALIFYLEDKMDSILVEYSDVTDIATDDSFDHKEKKKLLETIEEAKTKEVAKKDANMQKQILQEYVSSAELLSRSPFFLPVRENSLAKAELSMIFNPKSLISVGKKRKVEFQLALRLPNRSKPLQVPHVKDFVESLTYHEPLFIGGKRFYFTLESFEDEGIQIARTLMNHARFVESAKNDRSHRIATLDYESFGSLLAKTHECSKKGVHISEIKEHSFVLPGFFVGSLETPLKSSVSAATFRFALSHIEPPSSKILMSPHVIVEEKSVPLAQATLFECVEPGMIHENVYYRFPQHIKRVHLKSLSDIQEATIPEPLFGTFVENSLPELKRFGEVTNDEVIESFITLPFTGEIVARCALTYLDGELDANLYFNYENLEIPASPSGLEYEQISSFVSEEGILARDLVSEKQILEELFQDFLYHSDSGTFVTKSDKKIVEFMTEIVPQNQWRVQFECPENLLDQFIYDDTEFTLNLDCSDQVGCYEVSLGVNGDLKGLTLDLLWDCTASRRPYVELASKKKGKQSKIPKILVLDLERITQLVQIFDEIGITALDVQKTDRPLWSLVNIDEELFSGLPIKFKMTKKLKEIRSEMLGEKKFTPSAIPSSIKADLRHYQEEGVYWLERLRTMYLNGILADDMGLGKTLQAIVAITQLKEKYPNSPAIVVCPTSLLYNWKEEIHKFNPELKVLIVDGVPSQRKKLIQSLKKYDVLVTTYSLMQKDVETYEKTTFGYVILDEAQHIKNRGTRNAKSVKLLKGMHRLILTGTPIENSLEELWSLFDFLMPGFLSSYDRFIEKYIRTSGEAHVQIIEYLKRKVAPFIMRRLKDDVLSELPPVSEILYHCQLANQQKELYKSYATSARNELTKLVKREGFDKVQIHVLATLTRLKQICCHPAIFAKEKPEEGDSAKYDMLMELLDTLIEGGHKTVIFSQYTRMLQIMREDLEQKGVPFSYLDGTSKNRLDIVKDFNKNDKVPVFLVSLKAGGTGLNITGADTVIHYDMWWNPAVENQATDRVHRIGQKKAVSSYKLVTKGSIEEKILEMQKRKKGLVKKVVSCDDEAISKLTWEEVLELLQT